MPQGLHDRACARSGYNPIFFPPYHPPCRLLVNCMRYQRQACLNAVAACASEGVHYLDLVAAPGHVAELMEEWDGPAATSGIYAAPFNYHIVIFE